MTDLMQAPHDVAPRLLAGRYELAQRLGRGGMGEVRAATDRTLGRQVAVKLLRADLAEQPSARQRFEAEARAAARLSHPNIVTVYDTGEDDGQPFLVMELLPGRTLADEIRSGGLGVARAVDVVCAVLSALSAAHREGIVHRDVKPGNVLLTADDVPKVADFGIAKTADASANTMTLTGELLATPAYLAPERISGEAATPASDIYAVGVLLYEALAGRPPYSGDTPAAVLRAIADGHAQPLAEVRGDVPSDVVEAVEQAMARKPSQRFSSADDMASALEGFVVTRGSATDPTIIATATQPVTGRSRSVDIGVGASDGETRVLPPAPAPAPPARGAWSRRGDRARHARRRQASWWWLAGAVVVILLVAGVVALAAGGDDAAVPPAPSSTSPQATAPTVRPGSSGASPLPAPLDRAIDRLEQVTR